MKLFIIIISMISIISIISVIYVKFMKPLPIETPVISKPTCMPGYTGDLCQYNDIDNCNGRGKVFINEKGNPECKCNQRFDGENCQLCNVKDGYGGNNCQFNDKIDCKGRGRVVSDKNNKAVCINCVHPFDGSNCEKCKPGYTGSSCQYHDSYCRPSSSPSSEQSIDDNNIRGRVYVDSKDRPKCNCNTGYYGNKCQFETSANCNYKGSYNPDNKSCNCMDGYKGSKCQFKDIIECGIGGVIEEIDESSDPPTIKCSCFNTLDEKSDVNTTIIKTGYGGSRCQFSVSNKCKDRGKLKIEKIFENGEIKEVAKCIDCVGNFTGDDCSDGKPGFYGKEYNCSISNEICKTGGTINYYQDGKFSCICNRGDPRTGEGKRSGTTCQFVDNTICNGRGLIDTILNEYSNPPMIKCICDDPKYTGDRCEKCAPGLKGPNCEYSDEKTCSGNGIVDYFGNCTCTDGFEGNRCQNCKTEYTKIKDNKMYCLTKSFCNNRGIPTDIANDGTVICQCEYPYTGNKCEIRRNV